MKPLRHLFKVKGYSLSVTFNCACARTILYGLWTDAIKCCRLSLFFEPKIAYESQETLLPTYCTMDKAGPDGAISLAVVILRRRKVMRCLQFYSTRRYFSKTERLLQEKALRRALEYVKNCPSGVSFVALSCSAGQILAQKITKFDRQRETVFYKVTYFFWLCVRTRCFSTCVPSFVAVVWCKWALRVIAFWARNTPQIVSRNLGHSELFVWTNPTDLKF